MDSLKNALALFRGANKVGLILIVAALAALCLLAGNLNLGGGAQATELEARLEAVLSQVEGAGRVRLAVGEGGGVLVVAQGASDIGVALALSRAVQTVLGAKNAEIEVLKMK